MIVFKLFRYILLACISFIVIVWLIAYWQRDAILKRITEQLNEGLNGELHARSLDFTFFHRFPRFSLALNDVYLRGNSYSLYKRDFFKADKIILDVGVFQLLRDRITVHSLAVQDADVTIFKTKSGYTNLSIFRLVNQRGNLPHETRSFLLDIDNVVFRDVSFNFTDSVKSKSYQFRFVKTKHEVSVIDSLLTMKINGSMYFDGLLFNSAKGKFLADRAASVALHFDFQPAKHLWTIHPSALEFEKSKLDLKGAITLSPGGEFDLAFASKNLDVEEAKTLVDFHLANQLRKYRVSKPVNIQVHLKGQAVPGSKPRVAVQFSSTAESDVAIKQVSFSNLNFSGTFINHVNENLLYDGQNSRVTIKSFNGRYGHLPVSGKLTITELRDPKIDLSLVTKMSLQELNNMADRQHLIFDNGTLQTQLSYKGHLKEYLNPANKTLNGVLNGTTKIINGSFHYSPGRVKVKNLNANFRFDRKKLTVEKLQFSLNENPVSVQGEVQDLIPFFVLPESRTKVNLKLNSPGFNLSSVLTPQRKQARTKGYQPDRTLSALVDQLIKKVDLDVQVKAKSLTYKNFKARNVSARMLLNHESLQAKRVEMETAGGYLEGNLSIEHLDQSNRPLDVSLEVNQADITQFFNGFDNFNQNTIQANNLQGKLSLKASFSAVLDEELKVLAPTMQGRISSLISEGKLIQFEPLQNMSNFLFKKRDFSEITFAELKSNFDVQGSSLRISRMEVQSSVFTFFLQGLYSFSDSTSLSVQLPLSNLKKRDKNYQPENIGSDGDPGMSVYLHVYRDKTGKMTIAYDPFKKWAKATSSVQEN